MNSAMPEWWYHSHHSRQSRRGRIGGLVTARRRREAAEPKEEETYRGPVCPRCEEEWLFRGTCLKCDNK